MNTELKKLSGHKTPTSILGGALSPEQTLLVAACLDGILTIDLQSGDFERLYEHSSYASSAHWLDNQRLISAGYDGCVKWFDRLEKVEIRNIELHQFWSWEMDISNDRRWFASVTGQYLAGSYKYEPKDVGEPCVCIGDLETGQVLHRLPHIPSVQSVAFCPDGRFVAAGNLMGEVRIFETQTGELVSKIQTPGFTSWGIIKSHCYLGGIFALKFTPDGEHLLLAGMGPMRDPMAGNGKQLWQRWEWKNEPRKIDETHSGENGEGLMEALAIHPSGQFFAMGGRLRGGDWNVALFSLADGNQIAKLKTGYRVTTIEFSSDGQKMILLGTQGQPKPKQGQFGDFGRIETYQVNFS